MRCLRCSDSRLREPRCVQHRRRILLWRIKRAVRLSIVRLWLVDGREVLRPEVLRAHVRVLVLVARSRRIMALQLMVEGPDCAWSVHAKEFNLFRECSDGVFEISYQSLR